MSALDMAITWPVVRQTVLRGFAWWISELVKGIPADFRARLIKPRPEFAVYIGHAEATITLKDSSDPHTVIRLDASGLPLEAEMEGAGFLLPQEQKPKVSVYVSKDRVLVREIELPNSAESRLKEIVGLDLDRQTPFTISKAMFDVAVRERRLDTGRIRIAIAVIARETLDQVVNFCGKLGVSPERIGIDHSGHPDNEFNFLPPQPFRVNLQFLKRPAVVLVAAISVLFLLNVTLAFHRMDRRISYLSIELAKARLEAQATDKLRAQLTRSEAEARVLAEARSQPGPLEVLNSLTRLLPDDVWLFQFEFRDKTVQIAGLSPSSADLIDRLEKSDEFSNPKFKAPVIRAGKDGGDRFEIGFELRPGLIR